VSKTPTQLEREIQEALGLPPAITKKWRAKVAAYKRAVAKMEAGYSDDAFRAMVRARDALDKMIYDATAHVPYVAGSPAHLAPPIQAMEVERKELIGRTWHQAQEKDREANYRSMRQEIKRLEEEQREAGRPYEWMKK
jgi:hypothetical protein